MRRLGLTALVLLGCADGPCPEGEGRTAEGVCLPLASDGDTPDPDTPVLVEPLSPPRLARRMSLDLRGVLPSAEELRAVEADPGVLADLRTGWLGDPRLEDRLVHLFGAVWHTRVDRFEINYFEYDTLRDDPTVEHAFDRAVGEEPLRLMAWVATTDRPWREILTTDRTRLPPLLLDLWPAESISGSGAWQEARYTDGRPAAGVLATNGLWWRYPTSVSNKNRTRAAAAARLIVCVDLLDREITVDRLGATDSEDAVRTSPECIGCHSALDPMAATMSGFNPDNPHSGPETHRYHPEREHEGPEDLGVSPAWFGTPVDDLGDLARTMSDDPRFLPCTVSQVAQGLWGRAPRPSDDAELAGVVEAFEAGDQRLPVALAAIMDGPTYQAGSQGAEGREITARWLWPDQLSTALEAATGFHWTWLGFELLDDDTIGYRVLMGGVEGVATTAPQDRPGLAMAAVWKRVAEAAADHAVATELEAGLPGTGLLAGVSLATAPGDPAFDTALASLRWRLLADRDPVAEAELAALWSAVAAQAGPAVAWRAVVAALLRDPLFVTR